MTGDDRALEAQCDRVAEALMPAKQALTRWWVGVLVEAGLSPAVARNMIELAMIRAIAAKE
jgi:hypothetical protein